MLGGESVSGVFTGAIIERGRVRRTYQGGLGGLWLSSCRMLRPLSENLCRSDYDGRRSLRLLSDGRHGRPTEAVLHATSTYVLNSAAVLMAMSSGI
jgi:hypothetical protein